MMVENKKLWISLALLAFAIGLILFGILEMIHDARSQTLTTCVSVKDRIHIREITVRAIDKALEQHVSDLFDIWMRDQQDQPKRAMNGMANGISAYQRAMHNALTWDPVICKE